MSEIVIADVLQSDVVDRTPAQVIAANPGYTFIGGASAVPKYLYQSLSTLWYGSSGNASAFPGVVVYGLGTGENSPRGAIEVYTNRELDSGQAFEQSAFRNDSPGAEFSRIYINIIKPKNTATLNTYLQVQNLAFRIRYLLDNNIRGGRTRIGSPVSPNLPQINVLSDPSIDPYQPYISLFLDQTLPTMASRAELCFVCNYVRLFTR